MKTPTNIVTLTILAILMGCGHSANQGKKGSIENDITQSIKPKTEQVKEEKKSPIEDEKEIDSLRLEIALADALKIAKDVFKTDYFTKEYEIQPQDSSYSIKIEIIIGRLFNDNQKYFLLRRHLPWATHLDLFKITDDRLETLIEREQGGMTFIRDTIFDVNGDGNSDFLVHWYPSSGCCRRNIYNVYLNQPDKGEFTSDFEFVNPTFSAKEKIIRGVGYGHPGEVGLYKFKWNELQVDTVEFIYPHASNEGQFIITNQKAYRPTEEDGMVLNAVPKEYHNIESYEWFAEF